MTHPPPLPHQGSAQFRPSKVKGRSITSPGWVHLGQTQQRVTTRLGCQTGIGCLKEVLELVQSEALTSTIASPSQPWSPTGVPRHNCNRCPINYSGVSCPLQGTWEMKREGTCLTVTTTRMWVLGLGVSSGESLSMTDCLVFTKMYMLAKHAELSVNYCKSWIRLKF